MDEARNQRKCTKKNKVLNGRLLFLSTRWFIIITVTLYFLFAYENDSKSIKFLWVLAISMMYNALISLFLPKNENNSKKVIKVLIFCDILFISLFCHNLGGMNSDIYILFFFIIGFCGIYSNFTFTLIAGIFSVAVFSISSIYSLEDFNYQRLVFKDLFIIMASFGVTLLNNEVKKYGELHKKEFKLARTDKLTGLANRHYFDQKLGEEVEYVEFSGNPLNILMFDLDNFKSFNDTYGHVWGDKLLTLFSDIIMQNIRKSDIPVRYGGEEFLILIRDLDSNMAKAIGERIRRQLEKQRIYVDGEENNKRVTVSCGLSQYPKNSTNIKEAIDFADKALYHAKAIGKNIVVSYDEIGSVQQGIQIDIESYLER